tara:strand:+ start:42 stop:728 length:687 start_codon:yes stop_codon:yes gene_type:complete
MAMDLKTVTDGHVVDAATLNSRAVELEKYINGGIEHNDLLQTTAWIKARHIRPPSFYGSPAPRAEFVSGDVHFRKGLGKEGIVAFWDEVIRGDTWAPIPGMAATIHVSPKTPTGTAYAVVRANWHCAEHNDEQATGAYDMAEIEKTDTASFRLFVNGNAVTGTRQKVCRGTKYMFRMASKALSTSAVVQLNHGINNVYIAARFNATPGNDHFRLHIKNRHMICEVFYL